MAEKEGKGAAFAHLSSDLTAAGPLAPPTDEQQPDPPFEELGAIPMMAVHDQPTQIVRAHKALDRARAKRRERLEEGRTYIVDRDKPPPSPPGKPLVWWLLAGLSVIGLVSVSVLVVLRLTQSDMMEEAIAEETALDEPLPAEPPPPPPIKRAPDPDPVEVVAPKEEPPPVPQPAPAKTQPGLRNRRQKNRAVPAPPPAPVEELQVAIPIELPEVAVPKLEEPPPPPPKTYLEITGPPGAQVEIDARAMGPLPLDKVELAPGRHSIWVTQKGFQVFQRDVNVKKGEVTPLEVRLTPIPPP